MSSDLVPSRALDFSKCKPGDVLCIPLWKLASMGAPDSRTLHAAITTAAARAGIGWRMEHDVANHEVRITLE